MSGESLKTILSSSLAKVKDIRSVSLTNAIIKTVQCALSFAGFEYPLVSVEWDDSSSKSDIRE